MERKAAPSRLSTLPRPDLVASLSRRAPVDAFQHRVRFTYALVSRWGSRSATLLLCLLTAVTTTDRS